VRIGSDNAEVGGVVFDTVEFEDQVDCCTSGSSVDDVRDKQAEYGADIRHIHAMLGHENLQTTAGYTHVAIEEMVEVYERSHPLAPRPGPPISRCSVDGQAMKRYAPCMVTRTLQISDHVEAALERGARNAGCSVEEMLTEVLRRYEESARVVDEGRADIEAGRVVDNATMKAWFSSWGDEEEQDAPACPE
jgi:predicted transcriptional regulator